MEKKQKNPTIGPWKGTKSCINTSKNIIVFVFKHNNNKIIQLK